MEDPLRSRQSRNRNFCHLYHPEYHFLFQHHIPSEHFGESRLPSELWSNPVPLQAILRFLESRTNPRSQENPSRSWIISEMVSLHLRWTPFLASWHHFFFFPWLLLTLSCAGLKPWKSWKGLIVRLEISRNIKFEVMGGVPATKYTLINHWAGRIKIIDNWLPRHKSYIAYILCSFPTIPNRISRFSS